MNNAQIEKQVSRQSAMIYVTLSLGTALAFLLASSVFGSYPLVAKLGGTLWVGLLSLIVTMPVVTANIKRKNKTNA